jgi:DNA-binding protein Fis
MFKQMTLLLIGGFLLSSMSLAHADYATVKVTGSIATTFFKTATTDQKKKALEDARKNALDKYIAGLDSQRIKILNNMIDQLRQNLTTYVPQVVALDDGTWSNGYWTVGVQGSIDEAQIEAAVNQYMQANGKKQSDTNLSFVFVAREAGSVMKFDGKKTEKAIETEGNNQKSVESDTESVGENTKTSQKVTGGSVEVKADQITYKSYIPEDIANKVSEVFNKANFSVIEPFDAGIDSKTFAADFVGSNEISDDTKRAAVGAARKAGLNYLAVATLDVGEQLVDQATGLHKTYVRVNGFVWDLNGKFTKKVCSVGPVQYSGLGEDPQVAKTNALINAGTSAAKDLVDQMRVKVNGL